MAEGEGEWQKQNLTLRSTRKAAMDCGKGLEQVEVLKADDKHTPNARKPKSWRRLCIFKQW
jgi:hypothetical protein